MGTKVRASGFRSKSRCLALVVSQQSRRKEPIPMLRPRSLVPEIAPQVRLGLNPQTVDHLNPKAKLWLLGGSWVVISGVTRIVTPD